MKVLWVTPQLPCLRSGGQVRQYHLLSHLCRHHEVTVLTLVQEAEKEEIGNLASFAHQVIAEPFVPTQRRGRWRNRLQAWSQLLLDPKPHYAHTYPLAALGQQLRHLIAQVQPDVVQFEHLFVAPLAELVGNRPWLLTAHNSEYQNFLRQSRYVDSSLRRLAHRIEAGKLRRWEKYWICRAPGCITVSSTDSEHLARLAPNTPFHLVPNGVDAAHFCPDNGAGAEQTLPQRQGLLFFGHLGYAPNTDAVLYFCHQILPLIRRQQPDVQLQIVGPQAPPAVTALDRLPGVNVVGFVEDVRPWLWQAAVCIVPLRSGGGTRLKILEALAAGCAVVSTSVGAEGLELQEDRHLRMAESADDFAHQVLELLAQPSHAHHLAAQGRQRVVERYDWQAIVPKLENAYSAVFEQR